MNCADVGNLIRKLRTDLNMTQKQPADKLGVSDKVVSKWERGLGCPMTKDDYISFAVFVTGDRMNFVKLYPEWDLHFRIPRSHGTLMWYGEKCGLLYQLI